MFTFDFIMNYNEKLNIGYTLRVDVDYPVYSQPLQRDLTFLYETKVINGINKLVYTFYDKKLCMSNWIFKTSFKISLNAEKVHAAIKF